MGEQRLVRRRRPLVDASAPKATLAAVSKAAGVSTATVSRMLNEPALVSEETRRIVQREIDRLGYTPNGAARALARGRFGAIGAIVPVFSKLRSLEVLESFQTGIESEGFELLVSSFEGSRTTVLDKAALMVQRGVDALLIVNAQDDDELFEFLRSRRVPFVVTWESESSTEVPSVAYEHKEASLKPINYLLDLGHRELAVVTGATGRNRRLANRLLRIRTSLAKVGIELSPDRIVEVGTYDLANARQAVRTLQDRGPLPTAIVTSNDILAAGAILECHDQGLMVPRDISVAGFGDFEISRLLTPNVTTVRLPRVQQGVLAARYLTCRLRDEDVTSRQRIEVDLIVRESTGSPRR